LTIEALSQFVASPRRLVVAQTAEQRQGRGQVGPFRPLTTEVGGPERASIFSATATLMN
jgi:hypothetical protein